MEQEAKIYKAAINKPRFQLQMAGVALALVLASVVVGDMFLGLLNKYFGVAGGLINVLVMGGLILLFIWRIFSWGSPSKYFSKRELRLNESGIEYVVEGRVQAMDFSDLKYMTVTKNKKGDISVITLKHHPKQFTIEHIEKMNEIFERINETLAAKDLTDVSLLVEKSVINFFYLIMTGFFLICIASETFIAFLGESIFSIILSFIFIAMGISLVCFKGITKGQAAKPYRVIEIIMGAVNLIVGFGMLLG